MDSTANPLWHLILNPHAGCGKGQKDKSEILDTLSSAGLAYKLYVSEYPGHTVEITHQLVESGASHFLIAGGDGSLNEAVNGLFSANHSLIEKLVIGMIPIGTGNDWSRTFGVPTNYHQAVDVIKNGKTVAQDVGVVCCSQSSILTKRYFVNVVGFGFDAMVAGRANELKNKGISGIRVYIQSFLWGYLNFRSGYTVIRIDNQIFRTNLFSASVGIGKFNGGGMMQVPEANPLNDELHITLIRKISLFGIIRNFKRLYKGTFVKDRRVSTYVGKHIWIKALVSVPGEADGESLGKGRFNISLIPNKLHVIYGNGRYLGLQ